MISLTLNERVVTYLKRKVSLEDLMYYVTNIVIDQDDLVYLYISRDYIYRFREEYFRIQLDKSLANNLRASSDLDARKVCLLEGLNKSWDESKVTVERNRLYD